MCCCKHKDWLDNWIPKILEFENSHQKFEWNCGDKGPLTINDKIVQFRPSGIRVKQPTYSPALVLTTTQIPIFHQDGTYLAKVNETRMYLTDDGKKAVRSLGTL